MGDIVRYGLEGGEVYMIPDNADLSSTLHTLVTSCSNRIALIPLKGGRISWGDVRSCHLLKQTANAEFELA
jgi:hypothetical protein